ncbi:SRPBCC family protein [Nubsella zeaxanthinifaciens]|uniref:SRPBCC family protein n=1 Tax=Nubsella zeaxanthinifaciens TaxID=392412 RepID=UPI003D090DA6
MPTIVLHTEIAAPIEICFDLSRSIDLHQISTDHTKESAVEGITTGLIGMNEQVTWQATHYGITQRLTSKITAYKRPFYFVDEQQKGAFKSIFHEHKFEEKQGKTLMVDRFQFESPYGILGKIFNFITLKNHLKALLLKRNEVIKFYAESGKWKLILDEKNYIK